MNTEPGLFITLYLDEHIPLKLASALRERGFDAMHAEELGMKGAQDQQHLKLALETGRTILTYNAKHFRQLHQAYWEANQEPCGIVISEELEIGELLRCVLKLLNTVTADEMRGQLRFLSDFAEK